MMSYIYNQNKVPSVSLKGKVNKHNRVYKYNYVFPNMSHLSSDDYIPVMALFIFPESTRQDKLPQLTNYIRSDSFNGVPPNTQLVHGIYSSGSTFLECSLHAQTELSQPQHNMPCDICWRVKYLISIQIQ